MAKNGPNKTVAAFRKRNPFPPSERKPCEFVEWLSLMARAGREFTSMAQAKEEFANRGEPEDREPDYGFNDIDYDHIHSSYGD